MIKSILYTIGHSNQSLKEFIQLLDQHEIEVVVDVRSAPYSRYVPHYNKHELEAAIKEAGLQYIYLGGELGGRPDRAEHYDAEGHALYGEMASTEPFQRGIRRLKQGIARYRVAIMCSEEDPTHCHRRRLVGRVLVDDGIEILHIRSDGRIDAETEMREAEVNKPQQQPLFDANDRETLVWRSTHSVMPG